MTDVAPELRWTTSVGLVVAGTALIAAPFLPFLASSASLIGSFRIDGREIGGIDAGVLGLFGAFLAATGARGLAGRAVGRIPVLLSAVGAAGLTAWYYVQVGDGIDSTTSSGALAGIGMWLAVCGSIAAILLTFRQPGAPWLAPDARQEASSRRRGLARLQQATLMLPWANERRRGRIDR